MPPSLRKRPRPVTDSRRGAAVFGARLRQARVLRGLSQEGLGTRAGIDEYTASARISQYETGKHLPHFDIARRLAEVLRVPPAFFYATDDDTAAMLLGWHAAEPKRRQEALLLLNASLEPPAPEPEPRRRRR